MKVAFWALGLIILGLFGMVMINLFGNIAVTNQLNYTTMKNDVEASMYDALDQAYYRSGFCLCTNKQKTNGKYVFNDESEYELLDIVYKNGKETCPKENCEILKGEYRLNKKVFAESLMRRLANVVNNNKDYKVTIKEVIEYPPKVSVRIDSHDTEFSPTDDDDSGYTIVNQMDALIETWNTLPTPEPTPTPTATAKTKKVWCWITDYRDFDSGVDGGNCSTSYKCCLKGCKIKFNYRKKLGAIDWKCTQYGGSGTGGTCYIAWSSKKEKEANCIENRDPVDDGSNNGGGDNSNGGGNPGTNEGSCTWHYNTKVTCNGSQPYKVDIAHDGYDSCNTARSACESAARSACKSGYTPSYSCTGHQSYYIEYKDGTSGGWDNNCTTQTYCYQKSNWNICRCVG